MAFHGIMLADLIKPDEIRKHLTFSYEESPCCKLDAWYKMRLASPVVVDLFSHGNFQSTCNPNLLHPFVQRSSGLPVYLLLVLPLQSGYMYSTISPHDEVMGFTVRVIRPPR